jgi:predicted Holliday junction resolvase-like endonuclease
MQEEPMVIAGLVLALTFAVLVVILLLVRLVRTRGALRIYRVEYPYTEHDLERRAKAMHQRSRAVVSGQVSEHLAVYWPEFVEQFNPRDAHYLGKPVDYVVFDGLDAGELLRVVFVEVKTGKAQLNRNERQVRQAIEGGWVEWQVLRAPVPELSASPPLGFAPSPTELDGPGG